MVWFNKKNKSQVSIDTPIKSYDFLDEKTLEGKVFCCSTNDIASGANTNETTMAKVLFHNQSATKQTKIYMLGLGTSVSANNNIFRIYRDPDISDSGIALATSNLLFSTSPPVSETKIYVDGTGTPPSNRIALGAGGKGTHLLTLPQGPTSINWLPFNNMLVLAPGKKLLVMVRPNTTGVYFVLNAFWIEE